jgi:multimeric flavodoxin WrbA
VAYGHGLEDVKKDEEGLRTARNVAFNMAWLLKKIHGE